MTSEYYPDITMEEINRKNLNPLEEIPLKITRTTLMSERNWELVQRIVKKVAKQLLPQGIIVVGVACHGSHSENPHHEADETSDVDITVFVKGPGPMRPYLPGFNFKSYQAMPDGRPLEVDVYLFNVDDTRAWGINEKEGYAASATLVYDPDGKCKKWLEEKIELTPGFRNQQISNLLEKAQNLLTEISTLANPLDQRLVLNKAVKRLVEAIYYFNWEYPADYKWRVSGTTRFGWKPVPQLIHLLEECNSSRNSEESLKATESLLSLVKCQAEKEGISSTTCTNTTSPSKTPLRRDVAVARLFTRVDKYSAHSIKKCARRLLPWNGHDLVWEGLDNVVDLIYLLNEAEIPKVGKIEGLKALEWKPRDLAKLLYQTATVQDYGNGDDALLRAAALREIFLAIKEKIRKENLFSVSSLYDEDFMDQDLFGERSPYMLVYKYGGYINRQQEEDTYAEELLKKMSGTLSQRELNYLWGMCSQYFVGSDEEFQKLVNEELAQEYLSVWDKVVNFKEEKKE